MSKKSKLKTFIAIYEVMPDGDERTIKARCKSEAKQKALKLLRKDVGLYDMELVEVVEM